MFCWYLHMDGHAIMEACQWPWFVDIWAWLSCNVVMTMACQRPQATRVCWYLSMAVIQCRYDEGLSAAIGHQGLLIFEHGCHAMSLMMKACQQPQVTRVCWYLSIADMQCPYDEGLSATTGNHGLLIFEHGCHTMSLWWRPVSGHRPPGFVDIWAWLSCIVFMTKDCQWPEATQDLHHCTWPATLHKYQQNMSMF